MEIISVVFVFAVFGSLFGMYYHTDKKLDEWRRENNATIKENRAETNAILSAIQQEIKEFHGRICSIEDKKKIITGEK